MAEATCDAGVNSAFRKLPVEILLVISENDGTITRSEAEEYRKDSVAERTVFVENTKDYSRMVRTYIRMVLTMKLTLY